MKLTKVQRQSAHEAFTAALPYLSSTIPSTSDKPHFICWAIRQALLNHKIGPKACGVAQQIVSRRLDNHCTFTDWLRGQNMKLSEEVLSDLKNNKGRKVQKTRKAWLKSMIEEFKPKVVLVNKKPAPAKQLSTK